MAFVIRHRTLWEKESNPNCTWVMVLDTVCVNQKSNMASQTGHALTCDYGRMLRYLILRIYHSDWTQAVNKLSCMINKQFITRWASTGSGEPLL